MLILVLIIIACSLISTVFLIGICTPLSAAAIPASPPEDDPPQIVIEESFREDWDTKANGEGSVSGESIGEAAIRSDLREWVAGSSVPILRSRGMTDEKIKSELIRDFALTEEQAAEILAAQ